MEARIIHACSRFCRVAKLVETGMTPLLAGALRRSISRFERSFSFAGRMPIGRLGPNSVSYDASQRRLWTLDSEVLRVFAPQSSGEFMINRYGSIRLSFLLLPALTCATAMAMGPGPDVAQNKPAFNAVAALDTAEGRFAADGRAIALYHPDFRATRRASVEAMAREFTQVRAAQLGISNSPAVLATAYQRDDGAFSVVRFAQTLDGVPVYGSDIAVTVKPDGEVIFVSSEARPSIDAISVQPTRDSGDVREQVVQAFDMPAAHDVRAPSLMVYAELAPEI
jgi:hypothetical protein